MVKKINILISAGSIFNFNKEAYSLLEKCEVLAKLELIKGKVLNADETGNTVDKKTIWLHCASNELRTYFYPHEKRGRKAMDEMVVLPNYSGTLIHDHWKCYYIYSACQHGLCNAHHIIESLIKPIRKVDKLWYYVP